MTEFLEVFTKNIFFIIFAIALIIGIYLGFSYFMYLLIIKVIFPAFGIDYHLSFWVFLSIIIVLNFILGGISKS